MLVVHENPGITQTEAAIAKGMDKATLGQMIDVLENKKLIVSEETNGFDVWKLKDYIDDKLGEKI
ncbi:hypothetical protein [Breznakia pachnodae]|uniref:DNA-binding MarR family transcriptional regulator n=1 Tax=Breznakia pachnodae TaxID=265178 RepID=A0ABU0E5C5_9FIRM|nr:hypothetical protein [Breznakia pachnodae]MDQ0362099.1 DNA-binding MarR family transcriptional regulator [Breznakia pachnodae]